MLCYARQGYTNFAMWFLCAAMCTLLQRVLCSAVLRPNMWCFKAACLTLYCAALYCPVLCHIVFYTAVLYSRMCDVGSTSMQKCTVMSVVSLGCAMVCSSLTQRNVPFAFVLLPMPNKCCPCVPDTHHKPAFATRSSLLRRNAEPRCAMLCTTTPVDLCHPGHLPNRVAAAARNTLLPYLTRLACVAEPGCHFNMVCLSGASCCPGRHLY